MCAIAGILDLRAGETREALKSQIHAMTDALVHRGPDGEGHWLDECAGIGLGHRRLAIVDLSPAGHQPMVSECGRYVLSFNGEVYNAEDLRPELAALGHSFRGHSDTEVIVEGFSAWGIMATLRRLIGMFAFAIWDRKLRTLTLVRDRMGIKPVYWTIVGNQFLFASEPKGLRAARPEWQPELDRNALASYLRFAYVPHPHCIYRGVQQLAPASVLTVDAQGTPRIEKFWDIEKVAVEGQRNRIGLSDEEAADRLEALLSDAVQRRMVADVPLGAFLSGGVDSSTVVALMQANCTRPVKTYTIGFHEDGYDEAVYAKKIAQHLGTDHTELYLDSQAALDVIPKLPHMYDEPFADQSQIPTFLVSHMTRRHVTVALSGDGGDELFGGYNRHITARSVTNLRNNLPGFLRIPLAKAMRAVPPKVWSFVGSAIPKHRRPTEFGDKIKKLSDVLSAESDSWMIGAVSQWPYPDQTVIGGTEYRGTLWRSETADIVPECSERLQYLDQQTYLPDDGLTKVDRATMAVALEARVPMIDHRIVELSWTLPPNMKVRGHTSKWLLRQVLYRYVPRELIERPKMGFTMPIGNWLRGPLREWAEDLLDETRLRQDGILQADMIRSKWREHINGVRNWQHQLWVILMFQAWKARWL